MLAREIDESTKCSDHPKEEQPIYHTKQSVDATNSLKLFVRDPRKHQTYMPDEELAKVEVISQLEPSIKELFSDCGVG